MLLAVHKLCVLRQLQRAWLAVLVLMLVAGLAGW